MLKPVSTLRKVASYLALFSVLLFMAAELKAVEVEIPKPEEIALTLQRVADRQIAHFRDTYSGREKPHHIRDWTNGALYVGMLKWAVVSGDGRYQDWLKSVADRAAWELHWRTYMADDHVVGQLYLDLYRFYHDTDMIRKTRQRLEYIMANPSEQPIELGNYDHLERWTWCDALFMGPPVWAKMSAITGDPRYLNWMMKEFKNTTNHLFDKKESLYYRDNNYIGKRTNNKKIFWARGNGWVFAGLTLILDELDLKSPEYKYFRKIYLKMAAKLIKIQTDEGHWAMSLIDAVNYPTPETSGTSFFTYGLAWGVNNGLLKREKYLPVIYKAWAALNSHITDDGMLGYVQPIGAAPGDAWPNKSEVYGTGAFLSAGSELYKLVKGPMPPGIPRSEKLALAIKTANTALDAEEKDRLNPKNPLFARFVPERKDDFAWENDLVAFRAYGPALRKEGVSSGIDCWLKRVKYPIIDKWYSLELDKGLSYHEDRGEGYDGYKVGASSGCGGTALWINGKREPLGTFVSWSDLSNEGDKLSFVLHYKKAINGAVYEEKKRITLIPHTRLFKVESIFKKNGAIAADLPIAVGIATHAGAASLHFDKRWVAAWEVLDGSGLGTAIVFDQAFALLTPKEISGNANEAHGVLIANTDKQGRLIYYAGYGWERAGEIQNAEQWHYYLSDVFDPNRY